MLRCYFLEGIGTICDGLVTATGTQGSEAGRKSLRGWSGAVTGLRNRAVAQRDRARREASGVSGRRIFPEGKAGAKSGRLFGAGPATWDGTPSGGRIGKASGRVARHDAKTASEHLTPVPAQAKRGPPCGKGPVRDAYRVYAPVPPLIHASTGRRNHIWVPWLTESQHHGLPSAIRRSRRRSRPPAAPGPWLLTEPTLSMAVWSRNEGEEPPCRALP
jgi:hypothetical protein